MNGINILCLVDASDETQGLTNAEKEAATLARLTGLRLLLLYVIERMADAELVATDSAGWQRVYDLWTQEASAVLERKEALIRQDGPLTVKCEIRGGETAYELLSIAAEQHAAVIVLPKSKAWVMAGLFTSTLTDKLVKYSPCPILWVND